MSASNATALPERLFSRLDQLGIEVTTVTHRAVFTVAESQQLERELPGGHTKNLFLKSKKGALYLVVAENSTPVDLKWLAKELGAGRFSFGKPDLLQEVLGVAPGSVTAFAVMNDDELRVNVLFDARLMAFDHVNCHPLVNTATTNIARDDLLRFIRASGHNPVIMSLSGQNSE